MPTALTAQTALSILCHGRLDLREISDLEPLEALTLHPRATTATMSVYRLTVNHLIRLKQHTCAPFVSLLSASSPSSFLLFLSRPTLSVA
jgi:hypothetical protein